MNKNLSIIKSTVVHAPMFSTINFWILTLILFFTPLLWKGSSLSSQTDKRSGSLKGFDENSVLKEFRQKEGSELKQANSYAAFLNYKKAEFIGKKSDTWQKSLPPIPPSNLSGACGNIEFETGDFSGWTGFTGANPGCCPTSGFVSNGVNAAVNDANARHTIVTGAGVDPCGGFPLVAPPMPGYVGGTYSCRLGNGLVGGEAERMEIIFIPTLTNNVFTYQYAAVLEDPGHSQAEQPYFSVQIMDSNGNIIPCTSDTYVPGGNIPGFVNSPNCGGVIYKPWTNVSVDLVAQIGNPITIRFTTADCTLGGHYGYAYVNCECNPLKVTQQDTLCVGSPVALNAPYEDNNTYSWTGPGGPYNGQIINVSLPGTYVVTMVSNSGCVKVVSYTVLVFPSPFVSPIPDQTVCLGSPVTLTSTIAGGTWSSNCGACIDPNTGVFDPSIAGVGTHTIIYAVNAPCHAEDTVLVEVLPPPLAMIVGNTGICAGGNVTLTASGGATYLWWNTANTTSTWTVNPIVTTSYIVEVKDIYGCSDTAKATVALFPKPVTDFSPNDVCINQSTNFSDFSSIPVGTITGWSWDFGDGTALVFNQNPSHFYASLGTFPVTLIVTSNHGCKDTLSKNVVVHPLPLAQFSSNDACTGSIVPLTDLSSISGTDIIQLWLWNFGDNLPNSNNQNPFHLYADTGSYTVSLLVISNFGCANSVSHVVTINPMPQVNFTAPDTVGCTPLCVELQNLSTISAGNNVSFLWNFGDGSTIGQSANTNHCYTNSSVTLPITFDLSLTVTSDKGCVSTFSKNNYITVNPTPIADFSVDPGSASIIAPIISYTNLSVGANAWSWDFGDFTASAIVDPLPHVYADTGEYKIILIVSNQYSCFDTTHKIIFIEPSWAFFIPNVFTPNGDGINDSFQGFGFGLLEYEMSIFDRWGDEIYHTRDYNDPWDGKANRGAKMAQIDVYVYLINIKDILGIKHFYRGIVSLVR